MTFPACRCETFPILAATAIAGSLQTAGAASARDAHVRSFDKTTILVTSSRRGPRGP
jgi:hypothetical protein